MYLKEIKNIFHKELDQIYPREEVDSFFSMLIEHCLRLERFILAMQPNLILTKEEEQPLFVALTELRLQRPIQHIIGKAHFMDMELKVNENVLIPRPETEDLVRWILKELKVEGVGLSVREKGLRILDMGTGSGCIAVAIAKNLPEAEVFALDISEQALQVAQQNALDNEVTIEFITADILNLAKMEVPFDIIVSNPPYVRQLEKKDMHKNVKDHEPGLALYVSDENPLVFYEAIANFARTNLKKNGILFLEINQYLAKETEQLLRKHNFSQIETRKDLFGNFRMIKCTPINMA